MDSKEEILWQHMKYQETLKVNGRILYIFTTKSIIGSVIGLAIGYVFYCLLKTFLGKIGLILTLIFAAIGYGITTLRIPDNSSVGIFKKVGGDKLDEVILRAIKFKAKGKRIYIYTKEENKKWVLMIF